MTMRLDVEFARPLAPPDRLAVTLAVAALANADRVRFARGDRVAVVSGEGLSPAALREALAAEGVTVAIERIVTSLAEDDGAPVDGAPGGTTKERVRPLGR